MHINPYLNFNGNCEAAFNRYLEVFGGRIEAMEPWGNSPICDEVPSDWHSKIMHVSFVSEGAMLMGSDSPPPHYQKPQGMGVALHIESKERAETVFEALAEGGKIIMPLEKTFWVQAFGMVEDRFGIPWMVNCE